MKRVLKIISFLLLTIIILFTIAAILLTFVVDPNKYKGRMSQYVYAKTGQVLVIKGDLHWSFFPWIGIKANNVSLYNPPNFMPKTFASAKEMDVKVRLFPLLRGHVKVGTLAFDQLVLNLIKNKTGQTNWQTLSQNMQKQQGPTPPATPEDDDTTKSLQSISITNLRIKNGIVNWIDQQNNQQISIHNFNLHSKDIKLNSPFPLAADFSILDSKSKKLADIDLNTRLTLSLNSKRYLIQKLNLKGALYNDQYPNGKINVKFLSDSLADFKADTFSADSEFELANIKGTAAVKATNLNKPIVNGHININPFDLRTLLTNLGHHTNTGLKNVAVNTDFNYSNATLSNKNLHIKFDNTDIFGSSQVQLNNKKATFNLGADEIKIDDLFSDSDSKQTSTSNAPETTENNTKSSSAWLVSGNLHVGKLIYNKLQLNNVNATVNYNNDLINISPLRAEAYQGEIHGDILIDKRNNKTTIIGIKQFANNINVQQMLKELTDSEKLSGIGNITANLTSTMSDNQSFLQGLSGNLNLTIKNGSLQGIDVTYQVSRAHSYLKLLKQPNFSDTKQTQFDDLTGSADITNGVLDNKDLSLNSEYLRVTGTGQINLVTKSLHYYLKAFARPKLAQTEQLTQDISAYEIPIKVTGTLNKPSVNLDFAELTKMFYQRQIKRPLEETVTKPLEKNLHKNLDNIKEKLKNSLHLNILDRI